MQIDDEILFNRGRGKSVMDKQEKYKDDLDVIVKRAETLKPSDTGKVKVQFNFNENEKSYIDYLSESLVSDPLHMVISMKLIKTYQ